MTQGGTATPFSRFVSSQTKQSSLWVKRTGWFKILCREKKKKVWESLLQRPNETSKHPHQEDRFGNIQLTHPMEYRRSWRTENGSTTPEMSCLYSAWNFRRASHWNEHWFSWNNSIHLYIAHFVSLQHSCSDFLIRQTYLPQFYMHVLSPSCLSHAKPKNAIIEIPVYYKEPHFILGLFFTSNPAILNSNLLYQTFGGY